MSNRANGTHLERLLAQKLAKDGFYAHLLTQSVGGQPADIIAVKNRIAYLIDCKDVTGTAFRLERVEPNQESAASFWRNRGNGELFFAVKFITGDIFMIEMKEIDELKEKGIKSVSFDYCSNYFPTFEEWLLWTRMQ